MKSIHTLNNKISKLELILFFSLIFSNTYAQPADEYYQQNIEQQLPSNSLPSDSFYSSNLRAGWDEDGGPGGSGEGDNTGVGVPVGDGVASIMFALMVYSSIILIKKKWHKKLNN